MLYMVRKKSSNSYDIFDRIVKYHFKRHDSISSSSKTSITFLVRTDSPFMSSKFQAQTPVKKKRRHRKKPKPQANMYFIWSTSAVSIHFRNRLLIPLYHSSTTYAWKHGKHQHSDRFWWKREELCWRQKGSFAFPCSSQTKVNFKHTVMGHISKISSDWNGQSN